MTDPEILDDTDDVLERERLVRLFFSLMGIHEHSFKVKDVSPVFLNDRYHQLVGELKESLTPGLRDELDRMFPFEASDANLSELQTESAALLGWVNGLLITSGTATLPQPPRLPAQLMAGEDGGAPHETQGQYL
jgi:hypothetical protein